MRPRIIDNPAEFDQAVERYIERTAQSGDPITLSGLIIALGLSSRQSLAHYEDRPEFCDSVRRAKLWVEHEYEKRLFSPASSGAVFALKNFGWGASSADLYPARQSASDINVRFV